MYWDISSWVEFNKAVVDFNRAAMEAWCSVAFFAASPSTSSRSQKSSPHVFNNSANKGDDVFDIVQRATKAAYGMEEVQDFNKAEALLKPIVTYGHEYYSMENRLHQFYQYATSKEPSAEVSERLKALKGEIWSIRDFIRDQRKNPQDVLTFDEAV